MKFLNLFKKEIKTKWSTRLLVAVFSLIICSIFASNMTLKNEYDKNRNSFNDPLKGFNKIGNQSFKHIKIENTQVTNPIIFDTSSQSSVFVMPNSQTKEWAENIFVQNDTLFIKSDEHLPEYRTFQSIPIRIFAPQIETINISKGQLIIHSLNQKSITINLSNHANFELDNAINDLDSFKISINNSSNFNINYHKSPKNLTIQTCEASLNDDSQLHLGNAHIKHFKLIGTNDNHIELSSETMKSLLK
jgi:hypothetical protein